MKKTGQEVKSQEEMNWLGDWQKNIKNAERIEDRGITFYAFFKISVCETTLPKKMNWLGDWDESAVNLAEVKNHVTDFYAADFQEIKKKIAELTEGYKQYWADVGTDVYGNHEESLQYRNGVEEWDKEIVIDSSRFYLTDDFFNQPSK